MKANLPEGSGVLVYDWPGALAFHSDLRILPADGLIDDFDYNRELREVGAAEYLCRMDVSYYVGRRLPKPGPVGPQTELRARAVGARVGDVCPADLQASRDGSGLGR